MVLNRLTKRAKALLLNFSSEKRIAVGKIIDALSKSTGVSSVLVRNLSAPQINRSRLVSLNALVEDAYKQSVKLGHAYVGTEHLLLALLNISLSPDFNRVKSEIIKLNIFPHGVKSYETRKTPILDSYGLNLNNKFKNSVIAQIDRDEINLLISILLQKHESNGLIVGDAGVGKNSLIEHLVLKINDLDIPVPLADYKVIEFDLIGFIASISNREGLEYGLAAFVEELSELEKVILYVKNFQNIFITTNAGLTVPLVFSMFRSDLEGIGIRMIATMNTSMYDRITSENDQILEGFTVVNVSEPDEKKILNILKSKVEILEKYHNVIIPADIVTYVYERAKSEIKSQRFPQKGLQLLDQACARLLAKKSKISQNYKNLVRKKALITNSLSDFLEKSEYDAALKTRGVLNLVNKKILQSKKALVGDSAFLLTRHEVDNALLDMGLEGKSSFVSDLNLLGSLTQKIKERVVGQDEAVDLVVRSLIRSRLGLRSKKRPIGSFLFLGPTGVGKTELAKVLASCAFGEDAIIRLDMSDFGEKHTVSRLVGAPPGYVGYGEGGELTQKIEAHPDSVVLFDEIEKAHPDVLNILLQIMEEGELTDARGTTFDFSRAVVVLTSNMGTNLIQQKGIGFNDESGQDDKVEAKLKNNLKKILKPELVNRFDEIIVFKKLKQTDQYKILDILLSDVIETIKRQKVSLSVSLDAKRILLNLGYSDEYGARSLRRVVEKELLDKVAQILLDVKERPLKIKAAASKGSLSVTNVKI